MIISIASGKGGTGKTTVATNLALSISNVQLLDCDVEEPNAHIFIKPRIKEKRPVFIPVPQVDKEKCNGCGRCKEVCAYNAIAVLSAKGRSASGRGSDVLVFADLCHGCGSCAYFCPQKAINEVDKEIGFVETGSKDDLEFIHGKLNIGQAMSPPLIRAVKKYINPARINIIDAPPGTSCPVIESIKGSNFCLLVTEPTPFGLNDLILAVETLRKLKIPFGVAVNRSDLGDNKTEEYCSKENIPILMRIPFKKEIASSYSQGIPMVEALPEYRKDFQEMFNRIESGRFR
ncbi:MAG: ATP-binding protein [Candidatus Omnitrophica bacterium]|nr:ATP-binding protein [Candidatus Omnitrophota bacterium]